MTKQKVAIIGASGYTGAELIRILLSHPNVIITELVANSNADKNFAEIYPQFAHQKLPILKSIDDVNFDNVDVAFCCLPHGTSQMIIKKLIEENKHLVVIDLSADFRLCNVDEYKYWYEHEHLAQDLQKVAVYGLSEYYRHEIKKANLIACPGCYPTSILLALNPLIIEKKIDTSSIVIDSKSGVTGAGKTLKEASLFCERNDNFTAYNVAKHRHISEIEQELQIRFGSKIDINFVPHLLPVNRGIFSTIFVKGVNVDLQSLEGIYRKYYEKEEFVHFIEGASSPSLRDVVGTNYCKIKVFEGRIKNTFIITSVIDNLTKGASGQAVQNMNIRFNLPDNCGLNLQPLFV